MLVYMFCICIYLYLCVCIYVCIYESSVYLFTRHQNIYLTLEKINIKYAAVFLYTLIYIPVYM